MVSVHQNVLFSNSHAKQLKRQRKGVTDEDKTAGGGTDSNYVILKDNFHADKPFEKETAGNHELLFFAERLLSSLVCHIKIDKIQAVRATFEIQMLNASVVSGFNTKNVFVVLF